MVRGAEMELELGGLLNDIATCTATAATSHGSGPWEGDRHDDGQREGRALESIEEEDENE